MCRAAMKHCSPNNVLGISSRIQLLFPPADAASKLFIGDTVISGICVALALCIAVPRGSKNRFFNYAFLRYTVSLTTVIIIIMNWFQSTQGGGQPALQYVASRVIGFVAVHCLWNVEVKQPMSEVWDSNMYGIKVHGWFLNVANKDGDAGDDGDGGDDDGDGGEDDGYRGEDGDGGEDDATFASEDYVDEMDSCARGVQLLSIRAKFRIIGTNAYDWNQCARVYAAQIGEVQQEGMDLVLTGPYRMLQAYSIFGLEVFSYDIEGASTDDKGVLYRSYLQRLGCYGA
ncbi:uncharacterized protein LOC120658066 isoform X2 [Panicum virgatum]|uniref:uncharacterized protein LOC120658066 isoform X2 n=1 Tax=Panicum virgatum TaxID=38727 RepID=UPI0019D568BA|nr:uncharacterized protein LOC120658066 isoform X2 [Panicum virgatum]